jgi:Domain of unknown function (DUF4579)
MIVHGYGTDSYDVTLLSKYPDKLFHLGRTIALNVGINFFDFNDISARHTIQHRCPYHKMQR